MLMITVLFTVSMNMRQLGERLQLATKRTDPAISRKISFSRRDNDLSSIDMQTS